jgi:hypothetical protein
MTAASRRTIATVLTLLLGFSAPVLLSGCSSTHSTSYYNSIKRTVVDAKDDLLGTRPTTAELFREDDTPLIDINYDATDTMIGLILPAVNKTSPIYVERFMNRIDPADPAPFGRLVADQVAARLAMRSFKVTDGPAKAPIGGPPAAPESVSPILSGAERKAAEAKYQQGLDEPRPCMLTGTYLIADKVVYVTAKLTAMDDNQVMAAHAWTVPLNRNTRALLPQARQNGGLRPSVRTSLGVSPHNLANPSGQRQGYVERDLVR